LENIAWINRRGGTSAIGGCDKNLHGYIYMWFKPYLQGSTLGKESPSIPSLCRPSSAQLTSSEIYLKYRGRVWIQISGHKRKHGRIIREHAPFFIFGPS
jgi:hypothetical protein